MMMMVMMMMMMMMMMVMMMVMMMMVMIVYDHDRYDNYANTGMMTMKMLMTVDKVVGELGCNLLSFACYGCLYVI